MRRRNEKVLRPVHPNAGLEIEYRRRIRLAIEQMHTAVLGRVIASYQQEPPAIAQDDIIENFLHVLRQLASKWMSRFDAMSQELAAYFAQSAAQRSDAVLRSILKKGGMSVEWRPTPAQQEILQATIQQNVALIRSIPAHYLSQVEQAVMRSVQTGRDLKQLQDDIMKQFGVAKYRAALIARSQNNLATAALTRARQIEVGVTEAVWMHSGAGKHPRPSHVRAGRDRVRYDVRRGWFDPDEREWILPGQLINCLPGDSTIEFANGVEVAYRHWFRGNLAEIVTENGKALRSTPNHPILTPRGWVAARLLNEGDYVIEVPDDIISSGMVEDDIDYAIPSVRQVFDTLRNAARLDVRSEVSLGGHFHGDVTDDYVDVVRAAWPLMICPNRFEHFQDIKLTSSYGARLGICAFGQCLLGVLSSAPHIVRSLGELLASKYALSLHPDSVGVASIPWGASSKNDAPKDGSAVNTVFTSKSKDARPPFVFPTKRARVVHVERVKFEGHVFNLQTRNGWYASRGIITHNCRCVSRSVIKGFS